MSVNEITETRQYLTFKLGNEVFATDVAKVREVLDFTDHHQDPADARLYERRDQSARQRGSGRRPAAVFRDVENREAPAIPASSWWRCCSTAKPTVIGALADSVEEVIDLEPDQIQPAPRIGTQIRTDFIKGMGKRDTQFIMILDIDRVFSAEELAGVRVQDGNRQAEAAA